MKTPTQPAGEPAGIIRKYYPNLGKHLPSPTWPALAAEWYSDLTRVGTEGLDWYVFSRNERASDKEEFRACVAMLLAEIEQHAHLSGYGYRGHYSPADLTAQLVAQLDSKGQAALRAVREWYTLAMLSPIEQFLYRARKIELWQNDRYQLATREGGHEEWGQEYAVLLLALQRAVPTAKKRLLRTAYTELKWLLPTLEAGRPLKWQRLYDEGNPFFSSSLTATYVYSEFVPLRPTQTTTDQITEFFFQYLHVHLFEKERHVWQALILLAGALGEAAPPTPETFREKQTVPVAGAQSFDNPTGLRKQSAALEKGKKVRFCNGFRPEDADSVAREIGLIDENSNIDAALTYKVGRLCGFYKQLKTAKKVNGSLEILRDYFAERYKMEPITSKPNPKAYIAVDTAEETETALKQLFLK